ncbi:MAG: ankyrin repeat domain-containing protein [Burkholderiaceae bacterium]
MTALRAERKSSVSPYQSMILRSLRSGNPEAVQALIDRGADLRYLREGGYNALLDALHGRDVGRDARLLDLLKLLVEHGIDLNVVSGDQESALRVLSRLGRFDCVRLLLDAGALEDHLAWTPLLKAVSNEDVAAVSRLIRGGAALEERDWWSRTPWLVAALTGNLEIAGLLQRAGADVGAKGRCGQPALLYAIEGHRTGMLRWLLDLGHDVEEADEFGITPLMYAADQGHRDGLDLLIRSGAKIDRMRRGATALSKATSREVVERLLDAGADPQHLSVRGRRALLGLTRSPLDKPAGGLADVGDDEFERACLRRFGRSNPELIDEPFWLGMIRSGAGADEGMRKFAGRSRPVGGPLWSAQRFGQSLTFLPDGRIVQIGGEHEDAHDPNFCIYNDVFVHEADGAIRIYGYPKQDFPPTDFHTATLVMDAIYVIGSVGYRGERLYGGTPVYRLDLSTFRIDRLETSGDCPGWIYKHRAVASSPHEIRVNGGSVATSVGGAEARTRNSRAFVLDLRTLMWRAGGDG